jgi:hypothetical protein
VTVVSAPASAVAVHDTVESLLASAEQREDWKTADSLSGSRFERVVIGGLPLVIKYSSLENDWIMRATGDLGGRQLRLLTSAVLERLPACIDHTIIGCAPFTDRGVALLMRDVSAALIPPGGEPIEMQQHRGFIEDMATMHAAYWGFRDDAGLCPLSHRYVILTPTMAELEAATPRGDPVPLAVAAGWRRLDEQYPADARRLRTLAADPWPLVASLLEGPQTFIHSDWKLGNLGRDGSRTILLDWDRPGEAPPLVDLAWYLAVNCDRLPESKEDTIDAYRLALESAGIPTAAWWDQQLGPALAGAFLQLGWSKTGDATEFGWWSERLAAWNR